MNRIGRIIVITCFVAIFLLLAQLIPTKIEATGPIQKPPTVHPSLQQSKRPHVPKEPLTGDLPVWWNGNQKCVGNAGAGCCVTETQKTVWGGFSPEKCPVYSK
jgi:hypothetical protein